MLFGLGGLGSVITIPSSASSGMLWGARYWTFWAGIMYSPCPTAICRWRSRVLCGCLTRFLCRPPPLPPLPASFRGLWGCWRVGNKRKKISYFSLNMVGERGVSDFYKVQAWLDILCRYLSWDHLVKFFLLKFFNFFSLFIIEKTALFFLTIKIVTKVVLFWNCWKFFKNE